MPAAQLDTNIHQLTLIHLAHVNKLVRVLEYAESGADCWIAIMAGAAPFPLQIGDVRPGACRRSGRQTRLGRAQRAEVDRDIHAAAGCRRRFAQAQATIAAEQRGAGIDMRRSHIGGTQTLLVVTQCDIVCA